MEIEQIGVEMTKIEQLKDKGFVGYTTGWCKQVGNLCVTKDEYDIQASGICCDDLQVCVAIFKQYKLPGAFNGWKAYTV